MLCDESTDALDYDAGKPILKLPQDTNEKWEGILAVLVLYNLTNVNISEKIRKIATIKVVGFYEN